MIPENAPGRGWRHGSGKDLPPAHLKADDAQIVARPVNELHPLTEDQDELARDLRCSRRHVEAMDRDGRLGPRPIRLGRRRVWVRAEIQAWLAAGAPDRVAWLAIQRGRP
jgi:predicted DNA-binding transcriptional regulator AlpA